MKRVKRRVQTPSKRTYEQPAWLPIDIRLIPDIFAFSHVKGLARLFLQIEIISSVCVVVGTLAMVVLKILQ